MRIAILAEGTRGDFGPLAALGARMTRRGHEVAMTASEEFRPLVEAAGVRFVPLPVSLTAYIATEEGQRLLHRGWFPTMRKVQQLFHVHREGIEDAFIEAGEGAEALVTVLNTQDRAQCLAVARGLPHAVVHFFPVLPTGEFPAPMLTGRRLPGAALRRATHRLSAQLWWLANLADNRAFARRLGLTRVPPSTVHHCADPRTLVLQAFSPSLVPRPRDWGDNQALTGYWQLPHSARASLDEELPESLADWIDAGEPPVFLGFGSMPVLDPGELLAMATEATGSLGVRAVLNASWAGRDGATADLPDHVRLVGAVDHGRLLPRCAAAVHHGGAGTVGASLRAGLPTMVCSVWGDQPFWGRRLEQLGAGAHVPFRRLDRPALEAGLRRLLSGPVRQRAAELGTAVRAEGDGTDRAAELLDDWLAARAGPARLAPTGSGRDDPRCTEGASR
jgi:sterol 3beta-glucosyltransferase